MTPSRANPGTLMSRPSPWLVIVAILALIQGLAGLVALSIVIRGGLRMLGSPFGQGAVMGTVLLIASLPFLLGPLLHLLFGWGALRRASWAWAVGVVSSLVGIGGAFFIRAEGSPGMWVAWLVVSGLTLVYLLSPSGRHALRG